ncbi:hypothetical protein [Legionella tucsonensis]|uniref:cNMP-binding protein n=1 Tax=Legionella tucsonensis TaxID=40335 RepID=A0A0W0ZSM6_9GAMM|nr:hypothetical protein [Legionella tucsonensis]KTD72204.1 cNMP-binding protein [Legionella tucsonensis]
MSYFSENEKSILRNSPLLNHLSEENYQTFMAISSCSTFGKGDILLREGVLVLVVFLCEVGLGLYYTLNLTDFCNNLSSLPAKHTKVAL